MELRGKIKLCLDKKSGIGKTSGRPWVIQTVILTTDGQYPKDVAVTLSGDDCGKLNVGDIVVLDVDISSNEYNGRWYTTVRAFRVVVEYPSAAPAPSPAPASAPAPAQAPAIPGDNNDTPNDDLPF